MMKQETKRNHSMTCVGCPTRLMLFNARQQGQVPKATLSDYSKIHHPSGQRLVHESHSAVENTHLLPKGNGFMERRPPYRPRGTRSQSPDCFCSGVWFSSSYHSSRCLGVVLSQDLPGAIQEASHPQFSFSCHRVLTKFCAPCYSHSVNCLLGLFLFFSFPHFILLDYRCDLLFPDYATVSLMFCLYWATGLPAWALVTSFHIALHSLFVSFSSNTYAPNPGSVN